MPLKIISAGAAAGLVRQLAQPNEVDFEHSYFGAVGAMLEKFKSDFASGMPCDVLILTHVQLLALAREISPAFAENAIQKLGYVKTGMAAKVGAHLPNMATPEALRQSLLMADALFLPDLTRSTAGAHVAKMLSSLGLMDELKTRIQEFANGATAMKAMAESAYQRPLGCTQKTEILYTAGVQWAGALPQEFELATLYSVAALDSQSRAIGLGAHVLAQRLSGTTSLSVRLAAGFESAE